jgi:hypothetical protein
VALDAVGAETRVQRRLDGLQTSNAGTFSLAVGDQVAVSNHWTLDAVLVNVTEQESRG